MKKAPPVFHPLLNALIPALALYVQKAYKLKLLDVLPSIAFILLAASLLWVVIQRSLKNLRKSGLVVSVLCLLFFAYGHVIASITFLAKRYLQVDLEAAFSSHYYAYSLLLLALCLALFAASWALTRLARSDFVLVTQFMNVVALVLAGLTIFRAFQVYDYYRGMQTEMAAPAGSLAELSQLSSLAPVTAGSQPDIYYIILDGYARADILADLYAYDNSAFLAELEALGFYVAEQSSANYMMTVLSLASSLNLGYLEAVVERIGTESVNPAPMIALIQDSLLLRALEGWGYKSLAFATGYSATEMRQVDVFLSPRLALNGYQNELINLTPFRVLLNGIQYEQHRQTIRYTFEQLPAIAADDQPTFTFAHLMLPHPPFVFDAEGRAVNPAMDFSIADGSHLTGLTGMEAYVAAYREQLIYLNQQILSMLGEILSQSDQPPLIILQADHGPGSRLNYESLQDSYLPERLAILNAIYFPGGDYQLLYPSLTPVNTFRIVLDQYFGAQLGLLADKNYFSTMSQPYRLFEVTGALAQP